MVSVPLEPYWASLFTQPSCLIAEHVTSGNSPPVSVLHTLLTGRVCWTLPADCSGQQGCGCSTALPGHRISSPKRVCAIGGDKGHRAGDRSWARQGFGTQTSRARFGMMLQVLLIHGKFKQALKHSFNSGFTWGKCHNKNKPKAGQCESTGSVRH